MTENKQDPQPFDVDLWEKTFSAITVLAVVFLLLFILKDSLDALDFNEAYEKIIFMVLFSIFYLSSAAFGAFLVIVAILLVQFRRFNLLSHLSRSLRKFLILFSVLFISSLMGDYYFGTGIVELNVFLLSGGSGLAAALVIHFLGRFI